MKSSILLLIAGVLAFPLLLQAEPANHDHGASAPHKIELNAGRKWATDEALRKGMTAIRTLVGATLPAAATESSVSDRASSGSERKTSPRPSSDT